MSGSAWAIGGRAVAAVTALASNALLARLLSPQDLGAYFLAYSVVGVGWLLGTLGLNHAVVRFVAESVGLGQPGRAKRVVRTVLLLGAAGSLGVGLAYLMFGSFLEEYVFNAPALAAVTGLVAVWIAVVSLQGLLAEAFRGFHDIRLATVFGNFNGLLTGFLLVISLASLWLLVGQATVDTAILLAAGASCISALLAGWALYRKVRPLPTQDVEEGIGLGQVAQVAWPLLITNLILFAIAQGDLWIVGAFRPQEEVAIYGAATRMVLLVLTPLVIVQAIVPPLIAEMYAQGKKRELERTLRTIATLAGIPAFLVLIVFVFFGGPILGVVFGDYYREGALVLTLLSIGQLAQVWAGANTYTLMYTGHQATAMLLTMVGGAVTVLGAIWSVNHYGIVGVATAGSIGYIIQNVSMLLAARYKTGLWTHIDITELSSLLKALYGRLSASQVAQDTKNDLEATQPAATPDLQDQVSTVRSYSPELYLHTVKGSRVASFSLILATLGRTDELERLLASLDAQTYRYFELIVVDQNPDGRLTPLLASYKDKFPILHLQTESQGVARARNIGLKYISGDIVAFPDDDCWYPPDLLDSLTRFFTDHPELDGITGRSIDASGVTSNGRFAAEPGPINKMNVLGRHIEYTTFLRKETAQWLRFDKNLGVGAGTVWGAGEGTDYLLRLLGRGASLYYDPSLVVLHASPVPPHDDKAVRKAYSYGYGMGHVLRKHKMPLWVKMKWLIRPLGSAVLSLIGLKPSESRYRWNTFRGRLRGMLS